ncbi:MAG: hypothetical protein ABFS32_13970 [Bacteroidota bacterium]
MLVSINDLPDSARVWIYQANKDLNADQKVFVEKQSANFCKQWTAHGADLKASFQVVNDRFLILANDEEQNVASGCSIDTSVHFVTALGLELDLDFLDREQVGFLVDKNILSINLGELKEEIEQGNIKPSSITFNLQAKHIADFREKWLIPAKETWMKRYFK